jgi:hypothetical protein
MLSLKNSLTEQPALPEEAQAQAQAQEDAHAQLDAQEEAQEERGLDPEPECRPPVWRWPDGRAGGMLTTFTWMKVFGELPYL